MSDNYITESEKRVAQKSCHFPINRTFTKDQNVSSSSEHYEFLVPNDWWASRSQNKCISLRECKVIPLSGHIHLTVRFRPGDGQELKVISFNLSFPSEANTYSILTSIVNGFNNNVEGPYFLIYNYNGNDLWLRCDAFVLKMI